MTVRRRSAEVQERLAAAIREILELFGPDAVDVVGGSVVEAVDA